MKESQPEHFRVLLIEDNQGDARLIEEMLREAFDPAFQLAYRADRLAPGLEFIAHEKVDLVLLDLSLPDSNGIETFLKVHAQAPHLPIIVLSGLASEDLALKTVHAGAQDYLVKGQVETHGLFRAMRYAVERQQIEETLSEERNLLRNLVDH